MTTCHSNFQRLMMLGLGTGMSKKGHFPSKHFKFRNVKPNEILLGLQLIWVQISLIRTLMSLSCSVDVVN